MCVRGGREGALESIWVYKDLLPTEEFQNTEENGCFPVFYPSSRGHCLKMALLIGEGRGDTQQIQLIPDVAHDNPIHSWMLKVIS